MQRKMIKWTTTLIALLTLTTTHAQHLTALNSTLPALTSSTMYFSSDYVQWEMNFARAFGSTQYWLPNGTIYCTSTLKVYPGTRNFEIIGQPNTRLVRATTGDYPLLQVGDDARYFYDNSAFNNLFQYDVEPVVEGQNYLDLVVPQPMLTGWYAIIGTSSPDDIVKKNGGPTYWFKREIFKVTSQTVNRLNISSSLGRSFENPKLILLEPDATPLPNAVCQNIVVRDFEIDGEFEPTPGRAARTGRNKWLSKGLIFGTCANSRIENVRVKHFVTSGINVKFSRNVTIRNVEVTDGETAALGGYGVEVSGSRFVNIYDSHFDRLRLGINFQVGSMDGYVENCDIPPGGGWFDVGHGTGDKRITYVNCIADQFSLANGQWLRGVDNPRMHNCSARQQINVFGGARNALIQGKYLGESLTTPRILFFTEGYSGAIPDTVQYVESCTVKYAEFNNHTGNGQSLLQASSSGHQNMVGDWIFDRCSFINELDGTQAGGAAVDLALGCANNNNSIFFDNCYIRNSNGYQAPVRVGPNFNGSTWHIQFLACSFFNPVAGGLYVTHGVNLAANSDGVFDFTLNGFNGPTMTPEQVVNNGTGTVMFH